MLSNLRRTVLAAYLTELQSDTSSGEHDGRLHLELDIREDIKANMIKPELSGYDEFMESNDENVIGAFEEATEKMMCSIEDETIQWIKDTLTKAAKQ